MAKRLIVGNWKMHLSIPQAEALVHRLDEHIPLHSDTEVVLAPGFIALHAVSKVITPRKFKLAAQNIHYMDEGAFTGETSPAQLQGLVQYAIIGHSERRLQFHEREDEIARKVAASVRNQITPILCVGENLFQRQDQETGLVIHDQLVAGLTMLTAREIEKMVIAYEPVWAIGTGENARPDQVKQGVKAIRSTITELYGKTAAAKVKVLYGGSVRAEFAKDYLKVPGVDGFLVGGASLNYEEFSNIVNAAH